MKKLLFLLFLLFPTTIFASNLDNKEVNIKEVFNYIFTDIYTQDIKTSKYINLNIKWVQINDPFYNILQKLVFLDILDNKNIKINPNSKITLLQYYAILWKIYGIELYTKDKIKFLKSKNLTFSDLINSKEIINLYKKQSNTDFWTLEKEKIDLLLQVYNTLLSNHYDKDLIDKEKLMYWAISWLTDWVGDQFTSFFPPIDSKNFNEQLSWEYEWIWAYVDMENPWVFKIISPISWSPAFLSWLKWWDIIKKIDDYEVTENTTLEKWVSLIKWKSGTKVKLIILRWEENLTFEITRLKVVIKDVESKIIDDKYYINIKMFWDNVDTEFKQHLEQFLSSNKTKLIIDLRNNPWGYLDKVSNMLSYFIDNWEKTVIVKYRNYNEDYKSSSDFKIDLSKYKIYILINSWTASASEIFTISLKDYFKNIIVLWEKSYWKWSVQTILPFSDWSSLKYTIAKWYSWKNQIWIDKVWIKPDIEIKLDEEWFKKWLDNQLDYIIKNY